MLDMEMPAQSLKLSESSPGLYEHSAPVLVMVGRWGMSFDVRKGTTSVLLGRSGSGKSTMLRCLNLLEYWHSGTIEIDGKVIEAAGADAGLVHAVGSLRTP